MRATASALLFSLALLATVGGARSASAQDAAVQVVVIVDSMDLTVELTNVRTPVGAVEIEVTGLPALAEPCELGSGLGACSEVAGVLRVVALNPSGWNDDLVLLNARLSDVALDGVTVVVPVLTDVDGVPLAAEATLTHTGVADNGSNWTAPMIVGGAAGVGAAATFWLARRRRASATAEGPVGDQS